MLLLADTSADAEIASLKKKVEMMEAAAKAVEKQKVLEIELATVKAESRMKTVALAALERNLSRIGGTPLSAAEGSPWG